MTGAAAAGISGSPPVLACTVPPSANGNAIHAPVTTATVTAVATGGTGFYASYAWSQVGSSTETWTITNATGASTAFRCEDVADEEIAEAYFVCTVTDSGSHVAVSNTLVAHAFARGSAPL